MFTRRRLQLLTAFTLLLVMLVSATAANADAAKLGGQITIRTAPGSAPGTDNSLDIALTGLANLGTGYRYEGWLVKPDGTKTSIGTFTSPSVTKTWVSPTNENLATGYVQMILTKEPFPDPDPATAGTVQYSATLKSGIIGPFRAMLSASTVTASGNGLGQAIYGQAKIAQTQAHLAQNATTLSDMQMYAQQVVNVIDGSGAPGDNKGIIYYANQTIAQANQAKAAAAATDTEIVAAADDMITRANRLIDRSNTAKDNATLLKNATSTSILTDVYVANVASMGDGLVTAAQNLLKASQNLGAYRFTAGAEELPNAGDPAVPLVALAALMAGLVLTSGGFVMLRRRNNSVA